MKWSWHHAQMTEQEARYDRIADGYATWWSPVHRPATLRLLDEIDPDVRAGARRVLDVGCGTGTLAAAAVARWPDVQLDGVDASLGMLGVAERDWATLPEDRRSRIRYHHGYADRTGFDDASVDVVVTAFVLQLVPSWHRALREARRVLRPGGRLAYVTWLQSNGTFAADRAFDDALVAVGLDPRAAGGRHSEPASPRAAVAQLRRAGFAEASATRAALVHQFTADGFLEFLARFDEEDLFASLAEDRRERLRSELLSRLHALPADGLRLELPLVYATGRRAPER